MYVCLHLKSFFKGEILELRESLFDVKIALASLCKQHTSMTAKEINFATGGDFERKTCRPEKREKLYVISRSSQIRHLPSTAVATIQRRVIGRKEVTGQRQVHRFRF